MVLLRRPEVSQIFNGAYPESTMFEPYKCFCYFQVLVCLLHRARLKKQENLTQSYMNLQTITRVILLTRKCAKRAQ